MKTHTIHFLFLSVLALLLITPVPASAQSRSTGGGYVGSQYGVSGSRNTSGGNSMWGLGLRRQIEHDAFTDLPFDDDDYSLGISYEYHEAAAYWQAALLWTPDADRADYVLTPTVNLVAKDNIWRGGLGICSSYMVNNEEEDGTEEDDWTDIYWQLILGVNLPVFGQGVDFFAHYVFEEWNDLDDFDVDDLEYGIWIKFAL